MSDVDAAWVEADRELCIGSGNCTETAVGVFELGEDGRVIVVKEQLEDADLEAVEEAVDLCPVQALVLKRGQRGAGSRD